MVTVELVNVNDNNPAFDKLLYTFTLQEEVQAGDVIGQITVRILMNLKFTFTNRVYLCVLTVAFHPCISLLFYVLHFTARL